MAGCTGWDHRSLPGWFFQLIEDDFGSLTPLSLLGIGGLNTAAPTSLTLNHVSSIGGSVIENTTPSMLFHTFRPKFMTRLTFDRVWDLEVTGTRNLLMGLGKR